MKKRLLLSLMAMCSVGAAFALQDGEFVYTPQGRFMIAGENVAASNFETFDGWTVVTATEGKVVDDIFNLNVDENGVQSAESVDATAGEGMYFKFESDANSTYVVSFKLKGGAANVVTRIKTDILKTNLVKVEGNTDGVYGGANDVLVVNRAEQLSEDWQTFNYAIVGDGTARTYFISLTGVATTIKIADLQIAPAYQVADLRQRDEMLALMNAYKNVYEWDEAVLDEYGYVENLEALEAIGDESSQEELDEQLRTCQEVLDEFLKENMEEYLATADSYTATTNGAGTPKVDIKFDTWYAKVQKAYTWGDWNCLPSGRGFWESSNAACADFGHYAGSQKWGDMTMGVYMQKELSAGSYVFSIKGAAAYRENSSSSTWTNNDGLKVGIATAYIMKVPAEGVEPTAADTINAVVQMLDPLDLTTAIVAAQIAEDGKYEIGYKVVARPELQGTTAGGVTYVSHASFFGKNNNKYSQKQLAYEEAVRTQITTGRNNLTTAAERIADDAYFWGKADLKACVDTIAPRIEEYEAMDQDAIIATYDGEIYENTVNNENGLLQYEVYQTATKYIIAANRKFTNVNDTLASLQTAIDAAEATMKLRVYDSATKKEVLMAAIEEAKVVYAQLCTVDYSQENAATVVEQRQKLAEAVETFTSSIPASEIVEVINLDFENGATKNEETGLYEVAGTNTVMSFSTFSETTPTAQNELPFELGIDSNGEKLLPGVLRVGNGTGTATIPVRDYGTNILKVSMDWWFVRLTGRYAGFSLTDESGERVAGLYFSPYDWASTNGYDDFNLTPDGTAYNSIFVGNTTGNDGSCADNNKTHIECILDYGEQTMYLTSTTPSGTFTSKKVAFNGLVPVNFIVQSNYINYNGRRCWFDNLKLEQVTAGAVDGIQEVNAAANRVAAPSKVVRDGRIIINGRYSVSGVLVK